LRWQQPDCERQQRRMSRGRRRRHNVLARADGGGGWRHHAGRDKLGIGALCAGKGYRWDAHRGGLQGTRHGGLGAHTTPAGLTRALMTPFLAGSTGLATLQASQARSATGVAAVLSVVTCKHDRWWPRFRHRGRCSRNRRRALVHQQTTASTTTPTA
jgi:hypothetical protein